MMVDLTPELAVNSIIVLIITYIIIFIFNVYMLYLNWKQSKVKDTTKEMVELLKEQNKLLKKIAEKK